MNVCIDEAGHERHPANIEPFRCLGANRSVRYLPYATAFNQHMLVFREFDGGSVKNIGVFKND